MQKIDGLIFDVDGTLWDSVKTCAEAWNHVIEKHSSFPPRVTESALKELFGKPMDEIFDALFPGIIKEEKDRLGKLCESYENELLLTRPGIAYPKVKETMEKLAEDIPLFIVSNCQTGYIEICMEALGITELITDYICFGENFLGKGENIRLLMERNHLKNPVYVGDTLGDERASQEAGIPMIYAAYGFGRTENPLAVIHSFEELTEVI